MFKYIRCNILCIRWAKCVCASLHIYILKDYTEDPQWSYTNRAEFFIGHTTNKYTLTVDYIVLEIDALDIRIFAVVVVVAIFSLVLCAFLYTQ